MAIINDRQYEYRRESAAARNIENERIAIENGMTEEQAGLVGELCSARHNMHCNISHLVEEGSYEGINRTLMRINSELYQHNLGSIDGIPTSCDGDDYIDIDDMPIIYETEQLPEDDSERESYLDEKREEIYEQWEELNGKIENYLSEIDKKYKTSYCPTGALRVF